MLEDDKKIDIIFERLLNYKKKNFRSPFYDEAILQIKFLIKNAFKDRSLIFKFEEIGFFFSESNISFTECIFIFDFLRKNFIAHLPNNINLREVKRIERFFEDIVNIFSKGYLKSYCHEIITNFNLINKHIIKKEFVDVFVNLLEVYIHSFTKFLESLIKDEKFSISDWNLYKLSIFLDIDEIFINKSYLNSEEGFLYEKIRILNKNFEDLIIVSESYKKKGLYKEIFFTISEIENIIFQIMTILFYFNTIEIVNKLSKDPLTGALTRNAFSKILWKYFDLSDFNKIPLSIIIADIDFFKQINDKYGHLAGDKALKHFVDVVKNSIRKSDYIFRFGGEEFIILLPNASLKEAVEIAEKIRKSLESTPFIYEGREIKITASFGVREIKPHENIEKIIKDVDEKLYEAKKLGRNKVVY